VANLCASWPDVKKAIEVGQRFSLEKAFIIQEKGLITWQKHIRLMKGKI